MIAKLLRTRRTRQLAQAIARHDVARVIALTQAGVDLANFKGYQADPIPHQMHDNYRVVGDVLEYAAQCHLGADGFAALLRAGAAESQKALDMARTYAQSKGAGPWPDAPDVAALLSTEAFQARAADAQAETIQAATAPAAARRPGNRL